MAANRTTSKIKIVLLIASASILIAAAAERTVKYLEVRRGNSLSAERLTSAIQSAVDNADLADEAAALTARIEHETQKLFLSEEMDAYRFGILVNGLLARSDTEVTSTKMIDSGGRIILEYVFQDTTPGVAGFLRSVAAYEKRLDIPYLSLSTQSDGERMFVVMRITYADRS